MWTACTISGTSRNLRAMPIKNARMLEYEACIIHPERKERKVRKVRQVDKNKNISTSCKEQGCCYPDINTQRRKKI